MPDSHIRFPHHDDAEHLLLPCTYISCPAVLYMCVQYHGRSSPIALHNDAEHLLLQSYTYMPVIWSYKTYI